MKVAVLSEPQFKELTDRLAALEVEVARQREALNHALTTLYLAYGDPRGTAFQNELSETIEIVRAALKEGN